MENIIDQELYHYFTQLNEAQKKSILQLLKTFVKNGNENFERITIEQYNQEIDEALAEVERGEVYTHEEVKKMAKDW